MKTYRVHTSEGSKTVQGDELQFEENALLILSGHGTLIAAFAPGHWTDGIEVTEGAVDPG